MDSILMAAIVLGGALAIQAAFWRPQPRTRARRVLRKVRNVPIAEIKDGEWVKVTGVAHAIGPVETSLIGRRECIGFQVQVVQQGSESSEIVLRRESFTAFTITDGTGSVEVDGPFVFAIDWEAWSVVTAERLRILREYGVLGSGFIFWQRFTYREALLKPGDPVTVFGLASFEPDPTEQPTDLRSPALKIHLRGAGNQRVILTDAGGRVSR